MHVSITVCLRWIDGGCVNGGEEMQMKVRKRILERDLEPDKKIVRRLNSASTHGYVTHVLQETYLLE